MLNTGKPPKNRDFLGLVEEGDHTYWDIFFWATKENGVQSSCFVDRELFEMPTIRGWLDLPEIEKT